MKNIDLLQDWFVAEPHDPNKNHFLTWELGHEAKALIGACQEEWRVHDEQTTPKTLWQRVQQSSQPKFISLWIQFFQKKNQKNQKKKIPKKGHNLNMKGLLQQGKYEPDEHVRGTRPKARNHLEEQQLVQ